MHLANIYVIDEFLLEKQNRTKSTNQETLKTKRFVKNNDNIHQHIHTFNIYNV